MTQRKGLDIGMKFPSWRRNTANLTREERAALISKMKKAREELEFIPPEPRIASQSGRPTG